MSQALECPNCQRPVEPVSALEAHVGKCFHCKEEFVLPVADMPPAGEYIPCTKCGKKNQTRMLFATVLVCPHCQHEFRAARNVQPPPPKRRPSPEQQQTIERLKQQQLQQHPALAPPPDRKAKPKRESSVYRPRGERDMSGLIWFFLIFVVLNVILYFTTGWVLLPVK